MNRYSYVDNNALKYIDPYGFEKVIILYGTYDNTDAFYAAAYTQLQIFLDMGYSMDDILFMAVSTDDQVIDAIAGSDTNEIEQMYIFSHGWGREEREAPGGGLQLSSGDVGANQFTSEDLEGLNLQDRFALDAEMNIKACNVGRSPLAQQIADTFSITVYASSKPMQFWKAQYWDDGFVDVLPGDLNSHGFAIAVPYNGDGKTYSGTAHVVMCPYLLGRIEKPLTVNLTIPWPFAYRPYEPQ